MPSKTDYKDFSARIRIKYPEYGNMDDLSLAKMWVEQNPQYGEFVVFDEPTPQKKSPVGTTPGQPVGSELVSSGDPIADRAQTQSAIKGYAKNKDKAEEIGFWENLGLNFANGSNNLFNNAFQTAYEGSLAMQGVPAAGIQELSKYKSRPLKEDFRTKTRQEMGLLEESTAAFANSLPIMLSSMGLGLATGVKTMAGKVASSLPSFISGFQESGKEADRIGIKDPLDRIAFQTAGATIEGVSAFILPDASLIRPLRQRALKDLARIGSKGLSKADVGRYVAEFTEKVAKEVGEEYAVEVGEALRGVSFAVAGYDSAMPEMKSARDYAVMTLSAAIGAGTVGGVGTLADAAYAKSSAIKKASENPEAAAQAVADLIEAGKLTEEQGNEFLTKVNMLSRASSRMPKNIDPEVAVNSSELLNQKMDIEEQINALEEEKKGVDDSFVPEIDTQIASLTEQLNSLTQQISSIRPTEPEGATIELDIPDAVDLSAEDQSVLDIMSSRFEEPYLNAINQRINNAEEISLSELENIAGDMINELTVVSESQDLTDSQKQQLSQLVENQIDNLLNYEFATTTTTEQAGQKTKAAGIISTPREGRPLPESKVSRERFEGAGVRIGGRGAGRITVKPIAGFGGRSVYGISFGNRRGVTPVEDLEFDNLEFVAPVILEDGSFNARMRDSKTGLELTITDPELSIDLAIAESLRQAGKTTFPQPAFLEAFNEVTKGTPTRTTTFPNIGRTGTAPEAAGVQPQTEQDVRQETNVTQERGDEGEASSRLPQEEGRQEGQVTPAVEGEAQASPTAKKKKTAQERADEQKATLEKLKETLKSLKAKPGGKTNIDLTFGVVPITKAVWNTAIDTAILAIDTGQTIAQAVKAASDYISSQIQGDWGKGKFESYMNDQFVVVSGEGVKQKLKLSSNPTLNTFLNELNQIEGIERSPIDPSELIYGETAAITLRPGDNENEIDISSIRSLDKGKGLGKKAMNDINSVADKLGITLKLNAKPFGTTGLSKADLIKFYQKAEFRADLTEYGGEFASEEEMISYVNEVDGEALPMIRLPNITETEIDVKDVSVKKNEDNDHIVSFKGVEVGKMFYDRSIGFWINSDFDRSNEKPYSVKWVYGDILGDTKDEAISELVNRFNKGLGPKVEKPTTQPDVLKDVESTAKALEGVDVRNVSNKLDLEQTIPVGIVDKIPRGETFQERLSSEYFNELKQDIKENGIKQPIILRYYAKDNALRLFEGHHRLKIAKELGIENVPIQINVVWGRSIKEGNEDIVGQKIYNPPTKINEEYYAKRQYAPSNILVEELGFKNKEISEAYHKAKKDGSNPELVKAVEDLLGAKAEPTTEKTGTKAGRAEYGKMKDSFFGGIEPNKNRLFFADATNDFQYRGDSRADIVLMLDGANFWLTEGPDGYVTIEDFQVSEDKLGTGKGKFALSKLIEYADRNGITLIGEPLAQAERGRTQKGLSQKQLIEFYKKNGFEKISKDSLSKNRTAEANYLERKPKDSVEKTETEKTIAESRREFREKARKYFDGLKKLGFAFDAERNAKEDIAFLKALKDYIKLEIDNGMVTFKGFIEKASAIMPEFSNNELKGKAKELWGQAVVKEYPKLMAKYSKVKQQQLEGEIKEIKKDLAGRILKMTSPKAVNVKGQIKTEKRKLSQEAAGQLATIRNAFDMKSMLAMDPKDLLELYNLTTQIYKEGKSDISALNDELNKQAESQGDAMLEAITSEGKRLQKLKDEATARKKLSLNAGVVIAMNEDERVLLKTEKELDALEGKGYTFMFLNTKGDKYSDRNFLMRFFSGRFRSAREIARDLRTALEFIKSPAKSSQDFINSLVEKMNKASVIKARNTDDWSSILKAARNRHFGSDLNFSYTNWMNGVPKVGGNVLEIEDGTGERIQGMTNAKIVTLYRQIMDPRNLVKPKGNKKGPRKINLTDKSIQDIIDYMNLPQNEAGKGFALSLNEFFAKVAKDVSQVLESNGYNADKLKEVRYDKDKVGEEFIVKIMDQFVSMRPDGFIPYTPVQATDSPDMAQGVEIKEEDLLGQGDLQKNFSVISNNMITKKPTGQIVPTDIRQTLNAYTAGMANMSAKLPLLRETQAVFSKRNLTAMNNAFAPQFTENLKANYISYMTDRVVPTSSDKTSAAIKSWLMQSTAIPMFLNFKSGVLQLIATPNFLFSYDFSRYIDSSKELLKSRELYLGTLREIINLPTIKQRYGGRFNPDSRVISDDTNAYGALSIKIPFTNLNISAKELLSKGYAFSSFGDIMTIAIGGAPVYYDIKKTNKAKYLSEGMSERDAESKAREDAEEKLYEIIQETQQSSDAMYLSQFQKQSVTRIFASFATATMQYYRKARRASLRMKNGEGNQRQNAYEILHYTVINAAVFQFFSSMLIDAISGPGEDELEEMNRQERMDLVRYMEDVMAAVAQGTGAMGVVLQALILGLKESRNTNKPEKIIEAVLRTTPSVRAKYESAVNTIREWNRGDYVKSFTKGSELVNIPADRIRALGLQVSDALTENLDFQERMYRLLGFRTESWMMEKKQGEIWDGVQSRIDNSTISERQRAISQTKEDYRSLFKEYGKKYAEAKTEAERKRIDSVAAKELVNVYNHRKGGEEFSDELREIASRSIEFYSLPKDLQELKDKNQDKKIETIVNEYIRLEKKDPKKADEYWSLLVANEIVSKNEIKKIAEEYDTEKGHR
jgi:GNAT superfamily N-acetyltransferase